MKPTPQQGYLLVADTTSGFAKYVAGTELEHSTEVLKELLELIVREQTAESRRAALGAALAGGAI